MTTDARVRKGTLKLTATGGGTADDYSSQIISCAIVPSTNTEDPVEVLSGDMVGGGATNSDRLNFTLISDHTDVDGLVAFSWKHRNKLVDFEFTPDTNPSGKWSGKTTVEALQVGGEVNKQLSVEGSWLITSVTPPAGYVDAVYAAKTAYTAKTASK